MSLIINQQEPVMPVIFGFTVCFSGSGWWVRNVETILFIAFYGLASILVTNYYVAKTRQRELCIFVNTKFHGNHSDSERLPWYFCLQQNVFKSRQGVKSTDV